MIDDGLFDRFPKPDVILGQHHYPLNMNDRDASKRIVDALRRYFGTERVRETGPAPASEDFGSFGSEWGSGAAAFAKHDSSELDGNGMNASSVGSHAAPRHHGENKLVLDGPCGRRCRRIRRHGGARKTLN
jgi:hypothetical protein